MNNVYEMVMNFKKKYPDGITWRRLKKHAKVIEEYLNPDEEVIYAFPAQKSESQAEIFSTCIVALTNKRMLIAQKRVIFGYFLYSITPDLYNDISVYKGLVWGKITIDTVKETIHLSNLDKKSLDEIETNISEYMIDQKRKYYNRDNI